MPGLSRRRQLNAIYGVGGITIEVRGPGADRPPPETREFMVETAEPEVTCEGEYAPITLDSSARQLFDPGGVWRVDELADGRIQVVLRAGGRQGRPYHVALLDPDLCRGEVTLDPKLVGETPDPFPLRAPLHELWTQFLLMQGRGALLHSCALLSSGQVHLFAGASGAGKSTIAALLSGRYGAILSDDRVVVRPDGNGFLAYGTPWHGLRPFASPQSGRLASVHFLAHGTPTRRLALPRHEATARLLACCFLAGWQPQGTKDLLETCVRIVDRVPCYAFPFAPDDAAPRVAGLEPVA